MRKLVFVVVLIGSVALCNVVFAGSDYTIYPGSIFHASTESWYEHLNYSSLGKAYSSQQVNMIAPITRQRTSANSIEAWVYVQEQADDNRIQCNLYSRSSDQEGSVYNIDTDSTSMSGTGNDTLYMSVDAIDDDLEFFVFCRTPYRDSWRIYTLKIKENY